MGEEENGWKKVFKVDPVTQLVSMMVLSGCSSPSATTTGGAAGSTTGEKPLKIAMVANASIADGGWTTACYRAMVTASEKNGYESAYSENVPQSDYFTMFKQYADLGYELIFAPGGQYADSIKELAPLYPNTNFILLNGTLKDIPNVTNVMPDAKQIGLLAGALAGLQTKTNSIGFIGGMELDTTKISQPATKQRLKKSTRRSVSPTLMPVPLMTRPKARRSPPPWSPP